MEEAINGQINMRFTLHTFTAQCLPTASFKGLKAVCTTGLMVQYHEEMLHAMKFYEIS